jgi:hypothetical protein
MSSRWTLWRAADHEPPVEMRFIDMFMAAIGALIFMALLMSVVVGEIESASAGPGRGSGGAGPSPRMEKRLPLTIVTKQLPDASTGEPYEVAFAYRGGAAPVEWEIVAGKQELPQGLAFDPKDGVLAGIPQDVRTVRFIVQARAGSSDVAHRPFELRVVEGGRGSKGVPAWVRTALLLVVALLWLFSVVAVLAQKQRLRTLEEAWELGEKEVAIQTPGSAETTLVALPAGIPEHRSRLQGTRLFRNIVSLMLLALCAWLVWLTWFAA